MHCLNCKFCKQLGEQDEMGNLTVECTAANRVIFEPFNAKHFYCVEYPSFSELSETEIEKIADANTIDERVAAYRRYCEIYYPKSRVATMVAEKRKELAEYLSAKGYN